MLVHWKKLCSLGILFWLGMTVYDYIYGSILVPGEFDKTLNDFRTEYDRKPLTHQTHPNKQVLPQFPDAQEEASQWSFWTYSFTGLSSLTICGLAYLSFKLYPKRMTPSTELVATNNAIRSALFDQSREYETIEPCSDNILIIHENKCNMCATNRFKSKEELADAAREISSLNKKLDGVNEEKRNLTRFLAQSEKDNRIIKQKMMEVLRDKNVLLKRLEAATREIRSNTVARQATLDKLEESIQCSNQLKQQIQQMSAEKSDLLRRLRQVETQCKTMKRLQNQDNKSTNKSPSNGVRPQSGKSVDSTKDIEQIEMKLHDLEASLEKMKCKGSGKSEDYESEDNDDTEDEPKILRQVSSSDLNFLTEVEPSYTNLIGNYECDSGHQQIVESIAPAVALYSDRRHKFAVTNTLGSALFNILQLIQKQHSECINCALLRPSNSSGPVIVNYAVVCNYKCPYAERIAMLGSNYFGKNMSASYKKKSADIDEKQEGESMLDKGEGYGCQEMVKYVQLPRNII